MLVKIPVLGPPSCRPVKETRIPRSRSISVYQEIRNVVKEEARTGATRNRITRSAPRPSPSDLQVQPGFRDSGRPQIYVAELVTASRSHAVPPVVGCCPDSPVHPATVFAAE